MNLDKSPAFDDKLSNERFRSNSIDESKHLKSPSKSNVGSSSHQADEAGGDDANIVSSGVSNAHQTEAEKVEKDGRSIYVGNVDYQCTANDLEEHFKDCGAVARVTILCNKQTGQPKVIFRIFYIDWRCYLFLDLWLTD